MRMADCGRAFKVTSLVLALGLLLSSAICGALAQNSRLVPPLDNTLADLYQHAEDLFYQSNDPAAALEAAKKFESEVKKRFGTNNWQYARALELIGTIYQGMGRTDEAAPYLRQGGALRESSSAGASSPAELPQKLYEKAQMYSSYGRFIEAEPVYERALQLKEQAVGVNHPDTAMYLYGVGFVYGALQRYADAEPFLVRALAAQAKFAIPNDTNMARGMVQLALAYQNMGHPVEAEALYKRAITILSASLGPEHFGVAQVLNSLAALHLELGRNAEAETAAQHSLAILKKTASQNQEQIGWTMITLGRIYDATRRYPEAERAYKPALGILANVLNNYRGDSRFMEALRQLGLLYRDAGKLADAEAIFKQTFAMREAIFRYDDAAMIESSDDLASVYLRMGRIADALAKSREAVGSEWKRDTVYAKSEEEKRNLTSEYAEYFRHELAILSQAARNQVEPYPNLAAEAFKTAQSATSSAVSVSLQQMIGRAGTGGAEVAALVRQRQDLAFKFGRQRSSFAAALLETDGPARQSRVAELAAEIADTYNGLATISAQVDEKVPDYASMVRSDSTLDVTDTQRLLADNEALVFFATGDAETHVFVLTRQSFQWKVIPIGANELSTQVSALRCGLDYEGAWFDNEGAWAGDRCNHLLDVAYSAENHETKPLPFDVHRANQLYTELFGEIESVIGDKELLIVPTGSLTQLPFHVLVTQSPAAVPPASFSEYRDVAWLMRKHATTVLPTVSSLHALRKLLTESRASEAYVGFGDPLLDGEPAKYKEHEDRAKLARQARCPATAQQQPASLPDHRAGAQAVIGTASTLADPSSIRKLPPLPETADELCEVAQDLGMDPASHLFIGARATESEVKELSSQGELANYRIVHFATHAAESGDVEGMSEPGLILTPPERPSRDNDGFLSASEIAALKLDADWVILSACNTAAGEAKGTEALSGLASAFFFAGARSLLVSHWEVDSDSTVKLITAMTRELKANPKIDRAQALRLSMLAMIDKGQDFEAHPAFWAPFVLVGGGAQPSISQPSAPGSADPDNVSAGGP